MRKQLDRKGFSIVEALIVLVVLAAIAASGWLAWQHDHDKKKSSSSAPTTSQQAKSSGSSNSSSQRADPYAGWKTYCDTTTAACIKYPSDWNAVPNFPGAFENTDDTGYVSLTPGTGKDEAQDVAYIQSIESITPGTMSLSIIGYIVNGEPGIGVYNSAYVSSGDLRSGATVRIVDGNQTFDAKGGPATLVATPGAKGYASITNTPQAKGWFETPEAQTCLKILRSLYYRQ